MPGPSEKPIVFVVDDDALVREAIEDLLQSVGLEVRLFASPGEFLKSRRPDAPGSGPLSISTTPVPQRAMLSPNARTSNSSL